jgi:hypothetical protein
MDIVGFSSNRTRMGASDSLPYVSNSPMDNSRFVGGTPVWGGGFFAQPLFERLGTNTHHGLRFIRCPQTFSLTLCIGERGDIT